MKNKIKTTLVFCTAAAVLFLASCKGRVGDDVIDGDEYAENYNDGMTYDEEMYNSPAEMFDVSPDSANITK